MRLSEAASAMGGTLCGGDGEFEWISTDSRNINQGELFFALKGDSFNGEAFVERALVAGACCAVVTKQQSDLSFSQIIVDDCTVALGKLAAYKRNTLKSRVIAITGSCGKTSVKAMLKNILGLHGSVAATAGNQNNFIGVPLTILAAEPNIDFLVVEAGTSEKGEIGYLTSIINPDVAVVINVHEAHLEGLGSLEGVAEEKSDVYVKGDKPPIAVVNACLLQYRCFSEKLPADEVIIFSENAADDLGEGANVRALNIRCDEYGRASFDLRFEKEVMPVSLSVLGVHQIENALAAASCAISLDVPLDTIRKGLALYQGESRRMCFSQLGKNILIDDTYNANPASMRAAIDYLSSQNGSMLILGDMAELGKDAEKEHFGVGKYAAEKGINSLLCTGYFADDYADGFGSDAKVFRSKEELAQQAVDQIGTSATLLVKGSRSSNMDLVCREIKLLSGEKN